MINLYGTLKRFLHVLLPVGLCAGALQNTYDAYHLNVDFQPALQTESAAFLDTPYQGFYCLYGYMLYPDNNAAMQQQLQNIQKDIVRDTNSLVLIEINLKNFRDGALTETALQQLDTILSLWADADHQIILRFLYDWDGRATETEPENLETVKLHMTQTAEIVNKHVGYIYMMQGIFLGQHAEMHGSRFVIEDVMDELFLHLANVTDPSIYLSVRTPAHWRILADSVDPLPASDAFSGSPTSRLGLFNDGMLGSDLDLGTYGDTSREGTTDPAVKGNRAEELAFQNELCRYVPNGGEAVLDNPFNDLDAAITDLGKMHVSYLSEMHDSAVLNKWRSSVYTGNDIFHGCNGFDYIKKHLGFRYVLRYASLNSDNVLNWKGDLIIAIENVGFSNSYVNFPVTLIMENTETLEQTAYSLSATSSPDATPITDARLWNSGELNTISVPLDIRGLGEGSYRFYLTVTDPLNGNPILFANEPNSNISEGCYFLGELTVSK